mmetsp:Transcript_13796/g.26474  ORF Transcript_13796/g.26474 Transcript_13796/m.26474 type:complete len:211 (-) Transcript_13796:576-1208(-)
MRRCLHRPHCLHVRVEASRLFGGGSPLRGKGSHGLQSGSGRGLQARGSGRCRAQLSVHQPHRLERGLRGGAARRRARGGGGAGPPRRLQPPAQGAGVRIGGGTLRAWKRAHACVHGSNRLQGAGGVDPRIGVRDPGVGVAVGSVGGGGGGGARGGGRELGPQRAHGVQGAGVLGSRRGGGGGGSRVDADCGGGQHSGRLCCASIGGGCGT